MPVNEKGKWMDGAGKPLTTVDCIKACQAGAAQLTWAIQNSDKLDETMKEQYQRYVDALNIMKERFEKMLFSENIKRMPKKLIPRSH